MYWTNLIVTKCADCVKVLKFKPWKGPIDKRNRKSAIVLRKIGCFSKKSHNSQFSWKIHLCISLLETLEPCEKTAKLIWGGKYVGPIDKIENQLLFWEKLDVFRKKVNSQFSWKIHLCISLLETLEPCEKTAKLIWGGKYVAQRASCIKQFCPKKTPSDVFANEISQCHLRLKNKLFQIAKELLFKTSLNLSVPEKSTRTGTWLEFFKNCAVLNKNVKYFE